jgi:DNA-binding transcriptional ArsR family regulator
MHDDHAARSFAALGNATRLQLYRTLVRAGETGLNVGELQRLLAVPASTLAHHLASLVQAGLVTQERHGRETLSRVDYGLMRGLAAYLVEECCTGVRIEDGEDAA